MSCNSLMLVCCCLAIASARPQFEGTKADLLQRLKDDLMQPHPQSHLEDKQLPALQHHRHSKDEIHQVEATHLSRDKQHHDSNGGQDLETSITGHISQQHNEKAHHQDNNNEKTGGDNLAADLTTHLSGDKQPTQHDENGVQDLETRIVGHTSPHHQDNVEKTADDNQHTTLHQSEVAHDQDENGETGNQQLNREKRHASVLPISSSYGVHHQQGRHYPSYQGHHHPTHHGHNHLNHQEHNHSHPHPNHKSSCSGSGSDRSSCSSSSSSRHHGNNNPSSSSSQYSSSSSDSNPCWNSDCRDGQCARCAIP